MSRQFSLRLTDEEAERVEALARREGLYPHGLVRAFVRHGVGLEVPAHIHGLIEEHQAALHSAALHR